MWTLLLACAPSALDLPAAEVPARPAPAPSGAIPLAGGPLAVRYTLPPTARPGGAPAPDVLTLQGPFTFVEDKKKAAVWAVPLPVAPDLLPTASRGTHTFGSTPPPGFVVTGPDGEVPFEWRGKKRGTWGFDPRRLFVGAAFGDDPPVASDFTVTFPKATAAERSMNLDTAELGAEAFAVRTFTVDGGSHRGWFLPAPGRAEVDLVVPEAGVLGFAPGLVPAALNTGARSDGATVVVTLTADGVATELSRTLVTDARFEPVRVDLRRWAGARGDAGGGDGARRRQRARLRPARGPGRVPEPRAPPEGGDGVRRHLAARSPRVHGLHGAGHVPRTSTGGPHTRRCSRRRARWRRGRCPRRRRR